MQASGQESWPFSSSLKPDVTPGLPPFLKVYLKKKISFIFHFFSRDESKVNRENSGDYKPFLMATLIQSLYVYVYRTKPEKNHSNDRTLKY